ncbi:N66 matrix protein-like isoform X3 [Leptopilina boulardi]|uniref:N66 matrix protein-like isoform X2 n=1 Tax=Leptopilina boulardi TaxID=63433 RepID=UPI0021F5704F|nr:N66 matrix protein-like isoform X2 [Leptopilina boulardi]XP_051167570.1 N66 matrix protein-like isoform X3 [Leptopilina boulardi]
MASVKCFVLFFTLLLVAHSFARPGSRRNGCTSKLCCIGCETESEGGNTGGNGSNGGNGNNVGNGNNIKYMSDGGNSNNVDNGNVGSNYNQYGGHVVSNIQGGIDRLRITNGKKEIIFGSGCNNNC